MGIPKQLQAEVDVLESLQRDLDIELVPPLEGSPTEQMSHKIDHLRHHYDTRPVEVIIHDLAWWQLRAESLSRKLQELSQDDPECGTCARLRKELDSVKGDLKYECICRESYVKRAVEAEDAVYGLERYLAWKSEQDCD